MASNQHRLLTIYLIALLLGGFLTGCIQGSMELGVSGDRKNTSPPPFGDQGEASSFSEEGGGAQRKKVVITFLGYTGEEEIFSEARKALEKIGATCIEASPQDPELFPGFMGYSFLSFNHTPTEAEKFSKEKEHGGKDSINTQARAAKKQVNALLRQEGIDSANAELILVGHSQGGLVAAKFWDLFGKKDNQPQGYNIKGIVTIAAPLQGVALLQAYSSLWHQYKTSKSFPPSSAIKNSCLYKTIRLMGLRRGLTDMAADSTFIKKDLPAVWNKMKEAKLPFLAITAQYPEDFKIPLFAMPFEKYGYEVVRKLLGGVEGEGEVELSDGMIAIRHQQPSIHWNELKISPPYKALHSHRYLPRYTSNREELSEKELKEWESKSITYHTEALETIKNFCEEEFF